jgi:hypothetical protein
LTRQGVLAMGKNPDHNCTIVFVFQGQIPQINPFHLLKEGIISKEQMESTKFNTMLGGIGYENDDIAFVQNLNRLTINLKSLKFRTQQFLKQKILPLNNIIEDLIAVGVNFSCQLPIAVSKQFFNKENSLYSAYCQESDFFGATIVSSKDGYDQNITCIPDKVQNVMNFSINNHFTKPSDIGKFPAEIPLGRFSELESDFLKLRKKIVGK